MSDDEQRDDGYRSCGGCGGDGEVFHASCGVPDCEHAETCPTCGGSGERPTDEAIAELRRDRDRLAGDLMVAEAELAAYKERDKGLAHPFDRVLVVSGGPAAIAEPVAVGEVVTTAGIVRHADYCHATIPTPDRPSGGCICGAWRG